MLRGIVESRIGNRLFIRPALCECTECPRMDVTQAQLGTDIDKIAIGDKVESNQGDYWFRVDEFTPDPIQDFMTENRNVGRSIAELLGLGELPEGPLPSEDMLQRRRSSLN